MYFIVPIFDLLNVNLTESKKANRATVHGRFILFNPACKIHSAFLNCFEKAVLGTRFSIYQNYPTSNTVDFICGRDLHQTLLPFRLARKQLANPPKTVERRKMQGSSSQQEQEPEEWSPSEEETEDELSLERDPWGNLRGTNDKKPRVRRTGRIPLNLTRSYGQRSGWGVRQGIRELLQNL